MFLSVSIQKTEVRVFDLKVTKVRACGACAAVAGCWPTQKYVKKTRINLHFYAVLPESLSATVCEPRTQGVFDEDADHTTRTA